MNVSQSYKCGEIVTYVFFLHAQIKFVNNGVKLLSVVM